LERQRLQLQEYVDRCAMILEGWEQRDAEWLGDCRWGWVDYEHQLAYLRLDVQGLPDLRLFVWVNDFAFASLRSIHVIAASVNDRDYLEGDGRGVLLRRRDDVIAQLMQSPP
jgi:hypothetical protein